MDRHKKIIFMFGMKIKIWCDVPLTAGMYKTYACSVMGMNYNVHEMMRNESYSRAQRISTSKPLHTPSSAMRSTDDTHERCNQERTCIMSCVWDHAHDVLLPGPEQRFTDEFLASWFYLVTKHGFKSVCIMSNVWAHAHQRMRSRRKDCTTPKQILPCYSFFFHLACCILLSVGW